MLSRLDEMMDEHANGDLKATDHHAVGEITNHTGDFTDFLD